MPISHLARILAEPDLPPNAVDNHVLDLAVKANVIDLLGFKSSLREKLGERSRHFLSQAAMGAARLKDFKEISDALSTREIELAPLKGMAYSLMFDQGGPYWAMADIDILVRPSHYDDACSIMRDLGYEEGYPTPQSRSPYHHERGFFRNNLMVEIHRAFLTGNRVAFDYNRIWSRMLPLEAEGVECLRLCPEDTFLYHCFSMGADEYTKGLRQVWELYRLLDGDRPDLTKCATRAREWGTTRMTWCALRLLDHCYPRMLDSVRDELACGKDVLSLFVPPAPFRELLEHFVVQPSIELLYEPRPLPTSRQLLRMSLLQETARGAASFVWWQLREKLWALRNT